MAVPKTRNGSSSNAVGMADEAIDLSTTDAVPSAQNRAIWVSVAGTIVCRLVDSAVDSTYNNVPVGDFVRSVSAIRKIGTTATCQYFVY